MQALVLDGSFLDYASATNCQVMVVGEQFNMVRPARAHGLHAAWAGVSFWACMQFNLVRGKGPRGPTTLHCTAKALGGLVGWHGGRMGSLLPSMGPLAEYLSLYI